MQITEREMQYAKKAQKIEHYNMLRMEKIKRKLKQSAEEEALKKEKHDEEIKHSREDIEQKQKKLKNELELKSLKHAFVIYQLCDRIKVKLTSSIEWNYIR